MDMIITPKGKKIAILSEEECEKIRKAIKKSTHRLIFDHCLKTGQKYEEIRKKHPEFSPPVIQVWNRELKNFARNAKVPVEGICSKSLVETHRARKETMR